MGLPEDFETVRIALGFSDDPDRTLTGYERKLREAWDRIVDAALAGRRAEIAEAERRGERLPTIDERLAWAARHDTRPPQERWPGDRVVR